MKKFTYLSFILASSLCLAGLQALSQTTGDYRTATASVAWTTASNWQTWDGSKWAVAGIAPGSSNNVYVQAGHTVTLSADASCNNLYISTGTTANNAGGDGQIGLATNVLSVYGKLASYIGAVNTTANSTSALSVTADGTTPSSPITKTSASTGRIKFVGSSDRTLIASGEWGANATAAATLFGIEIALDANVTGTMNASLKASTWTITSGILDMKTYRIAADVNAAAGSDITIASGATVISAATGTGTSAVFGRTGAGLAGTLTINSGAKLKLSGAAPTLGMTTITNSGTVEYNGTSAQTLLAAINSGAAFNTYYNLTISNSAGATLSSGAKTVSNILTLSSSAVLNTGANNLTLGASASADLGAGSTLNINGGVTDFNSRPVVLRSASAGTARIAEITGTLSNATNVTIERYVGASPRKAWRLLGAPLTTASGPTIRAAWQEGAASATSDPNPGYGTHITAADGSATGGYDASSIAAASSIRYFDGSALQTPADITTAKVTDNGGAYFLYVRGDRSLSLATTATSATATTLRMAGTVNQGPVTAGVAGTGGVNFSLIPNPYPSNIDFELVRSGNGSSINTYYVWDANLGTVGAYRTIDRLDGTPTYQQTPNAGSPAVDATARYIMNGQAFWIPAQATLNFTESMKVSNNPANNPFRTATGTEEMLVNLSLKNGGGFLLADGVRAKFGNTYSCAVTPEDAIKMTNFGENLGIERGAQVFSVEKRAAITSTDTIFLKLWNTTAREYRLTIEPVRFGAGLTAYLEDLYLHTSTPLSLSSVTDYDFAVTADAGSKMASRFRIVFRAAEPVVTKPAGVHIYPNPVRGNTVGIYMENIAGGSYTISVYSTVGQLIASKKVEYTGGSSAEQVMLPAYAAKGIYRVEVKGAQSRYVLNIVKP